MCFDMQERFHYETIRQWQTSGVETNCARSTVSENEISQQT